MTQVYWDCLFENDVFYAKNVGMHTKISLVESEKKHNTSYEKAEKIALRIRLPEKY
ncbi:hypothetical protein RhiirC2_803785 [Rhizophagus irregularis]|uniref:Uncharacterized protein n=1 Tax=Rhizophagus irregularis TaxID=588596 RepID=A0A2N1LB02_9GLOM|nr:hypothetical protein RhiirC2_803785 [Rhizophagus irregularis]